MCSRNPIKYAIWILNSLYSYSAEETYTHTRIPMKYYLTKKSKAQILCHVIFIILNNIEFLLLLLFAHLHCIWVLHRVYKLRNFKEILRKSVRWLNTFEFCFCFSKEFSKETCMQCGQFLLLFDLHTILLLG